ncbi:hypothetical protein P2E36_14345 [Mannheimia haemolytica]|nr:hypothetical protein [Mannheimia haemolytica]MDW0677520.1 hypothetical protein [Mannheimia haemolytica]
MNEEKYFSVDVSDETHVIRLHETLEQAKQSCLNGATEAYEFAGDMDDHESYESYEAYDLPYAVYGVVLGRAKSDIRPLTDEERASELFGEPTGNHFPNHQRRKNDRHRTLRLYRPTQIRCPIF